MITNLFRREVVEAKKERWLGGIALAQPLSLWVFATFFAFAACATLGLLVLGQYARRTTVSGQLVPNLGLATVVSPTSGTVLRSFAEEGDRVRDGQALMLIRVPRATASGGEALAMIREGLDVRASSLAALERSQLAQLEAQREGYERQLSSARLELTQIEREVRTRRSQLGLVRDTVERFESVSGSGSVSQQQLNTERKVMLEVLQAQQSLERQATAVRRSVAQLEQSLRELPAQKAMVNASTQRDLATLQLERIEREASGEMLVKAPVRGLVATRPIEVGQAVEAGRPLFSLLPEGSQLEAQLLVPSRAIGFVAPGDPVLLRYPAFPYQKFGHQKGRVIRVSRSVLPPGAGEARSTEPLYRVTVALEQQSVHAYGKSEPLRPGMQLEADIQSERRKLYEWLLEPLYSLRGS